MSNGKLKKSMCCYHDQSGFSLIEIMVVVAIIGVMVAAISTRLSRNTDRIAGFEANHFLKILVEVRDEALISGQTLAVVLYEHDARYKVVNYRDIINKNIDNPTQKTDALYKAHNLPQGIQLDVVIFNDLSDDENTLADKIISFTPLGEISQFEVSFIGEDKIETVYLNDDNQISRNTTDNAT